MKQKTESGVNFFIIVVGLIAVALALRELSHIFIPLIIALFLYFFFEPLNNFLESKKIPSFLITILDIVITVLLLYGVGRVIFDSFLHFSEGFPEYAKKLSEVVRNISKELGIRDPFFRYFSFEKLVKTIDLQSLAGGLFTSTMDLLGSVLFVLFFFVFVLSGEKTIYEAIKNFYIHKKIRPLTTNEANSNEHNTISSTDFESRLSSVRIQKEQELENTFKEITLQIQNYIIAKFLVNLSAGVVTTVILKLYGLDYPIIWGLFVFLFNFIPTIGSAAALLFPVVFSLVQFDSFSSTVMVLIFMVIIQTVAFNIVEPMIVGNRLNLNPLIILLSVLIWGYIWGIVGMLLSVPITAIIKIIVSNSQSPNLLFISDLMSQRGEKLTNKIDC
jgi:predicted PurR-regulated permease PerM